MKTATKVSAYGLALAIVFGGAWVAGAAVGPLDGAPPPSEASHSGGHDATAAQPVDTRLPGLASADNGYQLELSQTIFTTGSAEQFRFRILGPGNAAITAFDVEHEKRLHFVLVRRDGSGYQHLHPGMAADGTWSVPLTLPLAGSYRVFTDFKPTGGVKTTPALISRPRDSTNRLRTTVCSVQPPWTDTRSLWTGTSRPVNPPTWSRP
jgi:hypothetical protein